MKKQIKAKYSVLHNWVESAELLFNKSYILIPFLIVGFIEALFLEILYFAPGFPFSRLFNPLVERLYGADYIHYPANFLVMPRLFSYAETGIYILFGVLAAAVTAFLVKAHFSDKPVTKKDAAIFFIRVFFICIILGAVFVAISMGVKRLDSFLYYKTLNVFSRHIPDEFMKAVPFGFSLTLLLANILANTFLVLVIPFLVINRSSIITSFFKSVYYGLRYFFLIFALISIPYLLNLPLISVKTFIVPIAGRTFPEMVFYVLLAGIFFKQVLESFIVVSASKYLIDIRTFRQTGVLQGKRPADEVDDADKELL